MAFRVVHYINQFFANVGGEEMAHIAPELREGKVGPGAAFETAWKGEAVIVNTIVCGDSFFAEHEKEAKETVVNWVKEINPDMFIAGPAFNAGRYGYACANIALEVKTQLGIPVLTGMYEENPGADLKDKILITPTANSAAGMRKAAPTMAALALKLMKGEKLGASCEDGYMPNGIRVNFFEKERGAKRAVKMLLNKINGKPFTTEFPMPNFDRVEPGKAIPDMSKVVLGLATSGGIV
ncbi:MAG: glycine/betaine/sarcosine/D-proline family reductase selenoprotein B, partial [Oscillospiraceae bacterium]|nr:glycine/betaine/sarcosine/D-proline family reductase selenoprotein B [Oscillospiraceae bacterium]